VQMHMDEIAYYYKTHILDNNETETLLKDLQKFFDQYEKDKNKFKLENDLATYIYKFRLDRSSDMKNLQKKDAFVILKYEQDNFEKIKNRIFQTAISKISSKGKMKTFDHEVNFNNSIIKRILKNHKPKHIHSPASSVKNPHNDKIVKIWDMKNTIIWALRRIMNSYYRNKSNTQNEKSRLESLENTFETYFEYIKLQEQLISFEEYIEPNIKYIKEKLPENIIIQRDIERLKVIYDYFDRKIVNAGDLDNSPKQQASITYLQKLSRSFSEISAFVREHKERNDAMALYDLENNVGTLIQELLKDEKNKYVYNLFDNDSGFKDKDIFRKFFVTAKNKLKGFEGFEQMANSAKAMIDQMLSESKYRDKLDKIENNLRTIFDNYYTRPMTYGRSRDSRLNSLYLDLQGYFEKQGLTRKITHL